MNLKDVSKLAREMVAELTEQKVDAVSLAQRDGENWIVEVEVIESHARMGDDDLLTAYRLDITASGELQSFRRVGRHNRTDAVSSAA